MIKRVLEISAGPACLSVKLGQLIIKRDGDVVGQVPCEDMGVLVVDHRSVTYTHSVFTELLKHNAAVVLCDGTHHPAGMLLPLETNTLQCERFRGQIEAAEPVKKQLWRQIVRAKIAHQAWLVREDETAMRVLQGLRERVRSGDPENIEAQAAKRYWQAFFQSFEFHRARDGAYPNNLLNYGDMVLRAAVARAMCSAGLLPSLGIHHRNRYNAFCLADDVIEPFRGFVDAKVKAMCEGLDGELEMDQHTKAGLLEVLHEDVDIGGFKGPLMVGLHRTVASLQRCFAGEQKAIGLPEFN